MNHIKAKTHKGRKEKLTAELTILRSLPNPKMKSLGSVVFLDHVLEKTYSPKTAKMPNGSFAHPHRGIATFSYILEGGVHHLDSAGGKGIVYEGGIQWMNAGNGIIHDEFMPYDFQEKGGKFHALQFWLNLPAKQKAEQPNYLAIQGKDVPEVKLANNAGKVRVLLGEYQGKSSTVPNFLKQFMYHIRLEAGQKITIPATQNWEYGIYMIKGNVKINEDIVVNQKNIAELYDYPETIVLENCEDSMIDIMLFGGEPYTESMVSYGPFIMNTQQEIALANNDFHKGKYGTIDYSSVKI